MNLYVYNPITRQIFMERSFLAEAAVPAKIVVIRGGSDAGKGIIESH